MNTATIDELAHSYDPATHVFEHRKGAKNIPRGTRPGWIVGNRERIGQGWAQAYHADVLRPLTKDELENRAAIAVAAEAKKAEYAALPASVRLALENAICLRKGKVRLAASTYKELTGLDYDGPSPYGPRLGKMLVKLGVAPESVTLLISRFVSGLKPW